MSTVRDCVVASVMAGFGSMAIAQCGMTPAAIVGGPVTKLAAVEGHRAAIVRGAAIELYDVTDPASPTLLDRVDARTNPGAWKEVADLRTDGATVYALLDQRQVWMFDTSGGQLARVGAYPADGVDVSQPRIHVSGGMLYFVTADAVEVVDVSRPDQPVVRSRTVVHSNGSTVVGRGNRVYTMTGTRLTVLDGANPDVPSVSSMGFVNLTLPTTVDGDRLWVREVAGAQRVYDIGGAALPSLIGVFSGQVANQSVTTVGGVSYLTLNGHFVAADLSNLSTPRILGSGPANVNPPYVDLGGGALATLGGGFSTVGVSDPASMTLLASRPGGVGFVSGMSGDGSTLWVTDTIDRGLPRLTSWDISDPASPRMLGSLSLPPGQYTPSVAADGGMVLLTWLNSVATAQIVDGTDPAAPRFRGSLVLPWSSAASGLALRGPLGAVASGSRNLLIDLSNPDAPTAAAELAGSGTLSRGIMLDGGLALVGSAGFPSIRAFDVSSPRSPSLRFESDFGGLQFFAAQGGSLAVMRTFEGLLLQPVGDPGLRMPALLGGDIGYMYSAAAPMPGGIAVYPPVFIDVTEPSRPFVRNWVDPQTAAGLPSTGIAAGVRDALAVSPGGNGVWILPTASNHAPAIREGFPVSSGSLHACIGEPFELSVVAVGPPNDLTYQWYRRQGDPIAGETSPTLRIPRMNQLTRRSYFCVISNGCGSTTYPTPFGSDWSSAWDLCLADFNCDDGVDFFDYLDYLDAFESGDLKADGNGDDFLDFFDYAEFVRAFETGC